MSVRKIPERVLSFIFAHIDSVGLLEVLLLLASKPEKLWTLDSIVSELRANSHAVAQCLKKLKEIDLIEEQGSGEFKFGPTSVEAAETVQALAETYRVHPHKIHELIFSSLKKARDFADAFCMTKDKREDSSDG